MSARERVDQNFSDLLSQPLPDDQRAELLRWYSMIKASWSDMDSEIDNLNRQIAELKARIGESDKPMTDRDWLVYFEDYSG